MNISLMVLFQASDKLNSRIDSLGAKIKSLLNVNVYLTGERDEMQAKMLILKRTQQQQLSETDASAEKLLGVDPERRIS